MTLPVDNYNDIINILNASVEIINILNVSVEKNNTDTTDGRTDSVFTPPTIASDPRGGGPFGCAGCPNPPYLPGGEVVLARGGCLGRTVQNIKTITEEEIGDIEFQWQYINSANTDISPCGFGHKCNESYFQLYINDVFVSNFDFNNAGSHGPYQVPGTTNIFGKFKLKEKLNSSELINNIIKNRTRRTCSCKFKTTSDSEECRELELQVKIAGVNSAGLPTTPHPVGQIQFTIKNESWKSCFYQFWEAALRIPVAGVPLVFSNPNSLGVGYCVCLPKKRWYPPETDTATVAL